MTYAQIETMRDFNSREPHEAPFYATCNECGVELNDYTPCEYDGYNYYCHECYEHRCNEETTTLVLRRCKYHDAEAGSCTWDGQVCVHELSDNCTCVLEVTEEDVIHLNCGAVEYSEVDLPF